jgi:hypothetical protein
MKQLKPQNYSPQSLCIIHSALQSAIAIDEKDHQEIQENLEEIAEVFSMKTGGQSVDDYRAIIETPEIVTL